RLDPHSFPTRRSSDLVLKDRVAAATIASVPDPTRALKEEADKRIEFLENPEKRRALQETLKKACWWTGDLRPNWEKIPRPPARLDRKSTRLNSSHVET